MRRELDWMIKALVIATLGSVLGMFIVAAAGAADFSLLPDNACQKCDRAYRRCQRDNCPTPTPVPSVTPSHTPKPTGSPIACEPIGGNKDYTVGQERMFCFDGGATRPLMEVSVKSQPSCGGELAVQLQAPSGARYNAIASQPNTVLLWEPGRWYLWTKMAWGNCSPFTFTPR